MLKMIVLPRQARDKHRENLTQRVRFSLSQEMEGGQVMFIREDGDGCERVCCKQQRHCALYVHEGHDQTGNVIMQVRKRSFLATYTLKCSFFPRQARDKHRETTPKKSATVLLQIHKSFGLTGLCCCRPEVMIFDGLGEKIGAENVVLSHLYTQNDHFAKTGSGQT